MMKSVLYLSDVCNITLFIWAILSMVYLTNAIAKFVNSKSKDKHVNVLPTKFECCDSGIHHNNLKKRNVKTKVEDIKAIQIDMSEKQHFAQIQSIAIIILHDNGQNVPLYNAYLETFKDKCSSILSMNKISSETYKNFGPFINDFANKLANNKDKNLLGYVIAIQTGWIASMSQ